MKKLGLENHPGIKKFDKYLGDEIKKINLQSTSCVKAIGAFLRNHKKDIDKEDLKWSIKNYQTDFEFLKYDIQSYRD